MTLEELERIAGRKRPSNIERRIAARVVLNANNATGKPTPKWIRELADD